MKKSRIFSALLCLGLFYFSEGKPCPETTRAHATKCNAYYKCIDLPSNSHVWMPGKCEKGLVYEPNLRICVLPGDDWDCNLGETAASGSDKNDSENEFIVYGINVGVDVSKDLELDEKTSDVDRNISIDLMIDSSNSNVSNHISLDESTFESSGDDSDDNRESLDSVSSYSLPVAVREGSGDLNKDTLHVTKTESDSKIDPNLTAQLQRLSQLVDGLKKTYQNKDTKGELQPHKLNAFLARFNIRSKLDAIDTDRITNSVASNTAKDEMTNRTKSELNPETKVILSKNVANRFKNNHHNSEVLLTRPDGSIIFRLPQHSNVMHNVDNNYDYLPDPKLSEETMQTVFELSKQLLANQNVRTIFPNPSYYQQQQHLLQPIYVHSATYSNNPFSSYKGSSNLKFDKTKYTSPYSTPHRTTSNDITVHLSGTNGNSNIAATYGIPLTPFSESSADVLNNKGVSNRYENNKLVTIIRKQSPKSDSPVQPLMPLFDTNTIYSQEIPIAKPFDHHPSASTIAEYYTPSPPLDDSNANIVFQPDRYPTIQYANIPRPLDLYHPELNYYHDDIHTNALFPLQIDYGKVKIRPNGQKFESMEMDIEDNDRNADNHYGHPHHQTMMEDQSNRYETLGQMNYRRPAYQSKPSQYHQFGDSTKNSDDKLLVNIGGHYISYDAFTKSILGSNRVINEANVEMIRCTPGARQPNTTNCTRYYVCNKKDAKILSFSCPSYTAFNPQTMICDAATYVTCKPEAIVKRYTVSENKRIENEALKALLDAKRRQEETLKTRVITNLLRHDYATGGGDKDDTPAQSELKQTTSSIVPNFTERPQSSTATTKRRKYYCKDGDKVADQTSVSNYFVCYKNARGTMKGHKMSCPKGLLFCSKLSLCTLSTKCS